MKFIIRWTGWQMDPGMDRFLAKANRRGKSVKTVGEQAALRFDTHDDAVQFCKDYIRKGRFGGDWQGLCKIEEVEA